MEALAEIHKGPRHSRVIGHFGEQVVCNWLSRSGFAVGVIDHIGIDLVAYDPITKKRLGISVKSRTRDMKHEKDAVNLFENGDRQKIETACSDFHCEPWIAIYVESAKFADLYLTSLKNYYAKYGTTNGKSRVIDDWKMTDGHCRQYDADSEVKHIRITFECVEWWPRTPDPA